MQIMRAAPVLLRRFLELTACDHIDWIAVARALRHEIEALQGESGSAALVVQATL